MMGGSGAAACSRISSTGSTGAQEADLASHGDSARTARTARTAKAKGLRDIQDSAPVWQSRVELERPSAQSRSFVNSLLSLEPCICLNQRQHALAIRCDLRILLLLHGHR